MTWSRIESVHRRAEPTEHREIDALSFAAPAVACLDLHHPANVSWPQSAPRRQKSIHFCDPTTQPLHDTAGPCRNRAAIAGLRRRHHPDRHSPDYDHSHMRQWDRRPRYCQQPRTRLRLRGAARGARHPNRDRRLARNRSDGNGYSNRHVPTSHSHAGRVVRTTKCRRRSPGRRPVLRGRGRPAAQHRR